MKVGAVQAGYVLLDRDACLDKAVRLIRQAATAGAGIVVLPEAFIPGTPIWIDSRPIWDGDDDWFALLVDQAVVVPGPRDRRTPRRSPADRHLGGDRRAGT